MFSKGYFSRQKEILLKNGGHQLEKFKSFSELRRQSPPIQTSEVESFTVLTRSPIHHNTGEGS